VSAKRTFRQLLDERRGLLDADRYEPVVERIARTLIAAFTAGRKVLWMGNGGST
jgi:phosphoheptose isomerase